MEQKREDIELYDQQGKLVKPKELNTKEPKTPEEMMIDNGKKKRSRGEGYYEDGRKRYNCRYKQKNGIMIDMQTYKLAVHDDMYVEVKNSDTKLISVFSTKQSAVFGPPKLSQEAALQTQINTPTNHQSQHTNIATPPSTPVEQTIQHEVDQNLITSEPTSIDSASSSNSRIEHEFQTIDMELLASLSPTTDCQRKAKN